MAPGAAARIDFLQTSDIGVDFSQHRSDSARVISPVDPDTGVNIVGCESNRAILVRSKSGRSNASAAVGFRATSALRVWK
jgi:hypothetical protein